MRIDLDRLRVATGVSGVPAGASGRPRPRPGERFLLGPVPWPWLEAAGRQRGRALHVGLALWHRAGLERRGRVRLPLACLRERGVDRYAARRGLRALEARGLVSVARAPGRAPVVTILATPRGADGPTA